MSEYFREDGTVIPVTIVSATPSTVTRIFEKSKDGYDSVQVGFGTQKKLARNASHSDAGGERRVHKIYKVVKEFRLKPTDKTDIKEGDGIDVTAFAEGDKISVASISKGKGFQGVVKRHGFHGGPRTHGQKHSEREPGSIGGGLRTHVPKGMRMAGRMGSDRIFQKNLEVVFIDKENDLMFIKGAIAGRRGTLVEIVSR